MHTQPMADSEGTFDSWKDSDKICPICNTPTMQYRVWESSCGGYEDLQYKCTTCNHGWWVDGIDS